MDVNPIPYLPTDGRKLTDEGRYRMWRIGRGTHLCVVLILIFTGAVFLIWYVVCHFVCGVKAPLSTSGPKSTTPASSRDRRSILVTMQETASSIPTVATSTSTPPCNQGAVAAGETQNFLPLCRFSCTHGYCPRPCICTGYGEEFPLPPETGIQACRLQGKSRGYDDLCAFACAYGYCPPEACTTGCEETNGKMNKLE